MKQKWIKNGSFLILCALLTFVYFETKPSDKVDKEVVVKSYDGYRQVVYMDEDHLLIPVTYTVNTSADIQDDVLEVYTLMKDPGNLRDYLCSVIPAQANLLDANVDEQGILCLNFDDGLTDLSASDELRFLEATSYVFCQLEGINGVQYALNGEVLNYLPNGKISLSAPLNQTLGINNFETSNGSLHHTKPMLVYFAKTIGDEEFYVPVSERVASDASLDEQLNGILGEISVSSTLTKASPLASLELLDGSFLENGHLSVNLNSMALLDEVTIDEDVYDLLLLSFSSLEGVEEVSIMVQGEEINTPDVEKVSDIIYNVVKI